MHERLGEFAHCEVREVAVGACNRPGAGVREEGISDAYYATSPSEYTSDFTRVYVVCGRSWYEFAFGSKLVFYKPLSDLGVSAEYLAVIYYCCAKPFSFLLGLLVFRGLRDAKSGSPPARKASVYGIRAAPYVPAISDAGAFLPSWCPPG